ncbi:MAG: hypothetical protein IPH18_10805 [Chitinophagaceae bacterium]|nr:hypothetical protein [Chitinophagaceae bacterium]
MVAQQANHIAPVFDTAFAPGSSKDCFVGRITITGNKKTKENIILREIPFRTGETYPLSVLVEKFEDARRQLMNTTLFHSVVVAAENFEATTVHIIITVKERWYLFPAPYLKPVDRNLNQWIVQQKARLDRVEYGGKLYYYNATGRNDKLKMTYIDGYSRQVSVSYDRMYIDKKMKWGLKVGFAAGRNREFNYNTIDDKQAFFKDPDNYTSKFLNINAEVTYRRAIRTRHSFGIGFSKSEVSDTILKLNPHYYDKGRTGVTVPSVYYSMGHYNLDYNPYPTKGYAAELSFTKKGLNSSFNSWELNAKGFGAWHLLPKAFLNVAVYGGIKLPFEQPFVNHRFFGYGDVFMHGYEYNVVDGVAGGYLKTSLNRELFNFKIRIPPIKRGERSYLYSFQVCGKDFWKYRICVQSRISKKLSSKQNVI